MIDAVIMIIPFRDVKVTNAERFGGDDAINRVLTSYVPRNGTGIEIFVNPTKEDKQHGYFPRITFSRAFKIECSLPKILFNNNVYELQNGRFESLLQALQEKLTRLGLFIEVVNQNISKTILQHYAGRIFNSIRKLNLDSSDDITLCGGISGF